MFVCYCRVLSVCSGLGARLDIGVKGNRNSSWLQGALNNRSTEHVNYMKLLDWGGFADQFCPRGAKGPVIAPIVESLGVDDE